MVKTIETITQYGSEKKNNTASNMVALFQSGPKTGAPIYDPHWGEDLLSQLYQQCPSGELKNIHSRRQSTDYGDTGVTQELVIIEAICVRSL